MLFDFLTQNPMIAVVAAFICVFAVLGVIWIYRAGL